MGSLSSMNPPTTIDKMVSMFLREAHDFAFLLNIEDGDTKCMDARIQSRSRSERIHAWQCCCKYSVELFGAANRVVCGAAGTRRRQRPWQYLADCLRK